MKDPSACSDEKSHSFRMKLTIASSIVGGERSSA